MKVMLLGFLVAIVLATGAGMLLNATVQTTADARYTGAGAQLRHNEAGNNLVGRDWSGISKPN
ncbi:hypothetical protein [Phreatobacter stygius]|uniref:Uncharacterized protein n=1 Tax=Phreatobacter stygius TaxID=1940610 RepID=A0A4D7BJM3_9HYPH|nr:hypothetical protein [Phreatobacter stygius]QCI67917.1 hypothetical protein E8M01_29010 [Phreatobacter stygius]